MRTLIIGGTGTIGRHIVRELSERGAEVAVMTRDPGNKPALEDNAEYIEGELEDRDSVVRAMAGASAVYLLTPLHQEEAQLGRDAVWAAADARVERLVFQSVHRAAEAPDVPHFRSKVEIAEELARTDLDWTVIAPSSFYQNDFQLQTALSAHGVYPQPLGPVGVSHVDGSDVADAAVACLLGSGHSGKTYAVVGPEAHTGEDCAAIWAKALDRSIRYGGDDLDAWEANLRGALPDWLVADLRLMFAHFIEHGLRATDEELTDTRTLLGRDPRSYASWVTEIVEQWV